MWQSIEQIVTRLTSYPWYEVLVEILVIWVCVYLTLRFLRGTRGAGVIKGVGFLVIVLTLIIRVLGGWTESFSRLNFIYDTFLGLLAILLIVVFQPELRRAMVRLGETRLLRPTQKAMNTTVDAVAKAVELLSKSQFGALIAIERAVSLESIAQAGVRLDARVSERLIQSIFWPNNPLHDLGVVIKGDTVLAAGVQFPLIEDEEVPPDLGSRHRAGLGLSSETDALVVIVSEETGRISVADRGRLLTDVQRGELASFLLERLHGVSRAALHSEEPDDADAPRRDAPSAVIALDEESRMLDSPRPAKMKPTAETSA